MSDINTKLAVKRSVSITIITFGTKLSVFSLIDVAAWKIPINKPIANAINKTGPEARIICQKAICSMSIFPSKVIIYTATNVLAREPTVIAHPSTRTNNSNLNGKETNIGESIIMPKDIKMDAITISITRNGKNNKSPI